MMLYDPFFVFSKHWCLVQVLPFAHAIFLKQDPLEAILVIFGGSFLNFFYWKVLENMKNDATFVRKRSSDHLHLGDAKMSKKGTY